MVFSPDCFERRSLTAVFVFVCEQRMADADELRTRVLSRAHHLHVLVSLGSASAAEVREARRLRQQLADGVN
jgi:hypothetical protein